MDRNQWNRNVLEHRIEQWREQRAQKMAARLQLNSTKPRTISSNVLGYVNYRQPTTVQPGFRQHGEGPRFNHHNNHVDQRWNPNYNYSGYRQHHSPHKQYHPADYRNHGYAHGSYHHQQHGQKKGGHFSSHKALYNERKSTNKPNKRYSSSCSSINNAIEIGSQNDCPPEQSSDIAIENVVPFSSLESNINTLQVNSDCSENVTPVMEEVVRDIDKESESDGRIQESTVPESDRLKEETVNEAVETLLISEVSENTLPEPVSHVDSSLPSEVDIVSNTSSIEPAAFSSDETPTLFVDTSPAIEIIIENCDVTTVVDAETISESLVEVNDHEAYEKLIEQQSTDDKKELSDDGSAKCNSVLVDTVSENSDIVHECTDVINTEIVTSVEEVLLNEQMTSEVNSDATNETLDLELNLSFKPEMEMVGNTDEAVDPLELSAEVTIGSASNEHINNEGNGGSYGETSYNENASVFPVALIIAGDSNTEASIIRFDDVSSESDNDLSKEIERVENKLANISIVNKDDMTSDGECFTPMKRERRQVLLDATNILPTSTIKFAVREVRKNDESEIIVTPVRRSARLSTLTPVSAHKNICVQKLEELSPEVIQKMKFVKNPALDNSPEC